MLRRSLRMGNCCACTISGRIAHPEVPCAAIVGMRNVLVHDYFGMDLMQVRSTSTAIFLSCEHDHAQRAARTIAGHGVDQNATRKSSKLGQSRSTEALHVDDSVRLLDGHGAWL